MLSKAHVKPQENEAGAAALPCGHGSGSVLSCGFCPSGSSCSPSSASPTPRGQSYHPNPRVFISVCLPFPAGLSGLTWCMSGSTLRWLCFIEGWDIKSYEQRVLWRTCSSLEGSAVLCQLSVLLKTNVTLIYDSPNWSWKEFGNSCLL